MEQMRNDAIKNIEALIQKLGLNPKVKEYFEQGKVYYSYLTAGGFVGSIDTIDYDERYPQIVKGCEEKYNCLVYHVIESGDLLSLLFVERKFSNRLVGKRIVAHVYNLKVPEIQETGEICLSSQNGALVRIS